MTSKFIAIDPPTICMPKREKFLYDWILQELGITTNIKNG